MLRPLFAARVSRPRRRRAGALIALLAVVCAAVAAPSSPVAAQEDDGLGRREEVVGRLEVLRFAGATRTDTARLIGTDLATAGFDGDTVLIARADAFPDSLAGSYLAGARHAPVLLTASDTVSPELTAALAELDPDAVVLLGGTSALGTSVEEQLAGSYSVQRIGGASRFATAAAIARQLGEPSPAAVGLAIVASGEAFPDALAAGAIAAAEQVPLLLTARDRLPEETADAVRDLGVTEVVLAGGTAAVSVEVEAAISALGVDVMRAAGSNRQETARAVAELAAARFGWALQRVSLVSGNDFPDAVAMAPHAGLRAGGPTPIALSAGATLGVETTAWLEDLASCSVRGLDIAGGEAAVSAAVADQAVEALATEENCASAEIDTTPPVVAFTAPGEAEQVTMGADGITLTGTAEDTGAGVARVDVRVDVLGDEVLATAVPRAAGAFAWSVDVTPAQPGTYTFKATAVDGAGNVASSERSVAVAFPDPDETLVFSDVKVLDAAGSACIQEVGAQDLLLTCGLAEIPLTGSATGSGVATGDVIVGEPSTAAPEGLLRRLGSCTAEPTGTRCAAVPVPLTEVFAQVDVSVQVPVTPTGGAQATALADGVTIEPVGGGATGAAPIDPSINRPPIIEKPLTRAEVASPAETFAKRLVDERWRTTFDVDLGDRAGLPLPLQLTGTLEAYLYVDVDLDIDIEWCWGVAPCGAETQHFKVELGGGERLEAAYQLATEGDGQLDIDPLELGSINLGSLTFTIGPVPVVVSATLDFELGLDGTLQGAITGRATQSLTLATGVEYRAEDGWHDLSRVDWEHDFSRVFDTGFVRAEVRPFVGIDLALRVYGVRGPYVRGEPYVLADVDSARDPLFNLYLGFRAAAGIEVDVLGIDYEAELLDVRTLVASSANYPPKSPPSVTIVGPDGFPLVFEAFDQVPLPGSPRPYFCCDVLLDYSADLSNEDGEDADDLYVRWTARNIDTGRTRDLREAGPDVARLTLPPGTWDVTGQVSTRAGDNARGTPDRVRVRVSETSQISVEPVNDDDAGALALAQAVTDTPDLITGARFEELPDGLTGAHALAAPGPCGPGPLPTRDCPSGVPGLGRAALLTTGSATAATTERNPLVPASAGSQAAVTQGLRGDSDTDVTVLAIDVDVPQTASCLQFTYRYASEELPEYVGSRFNDAFLAELDATTWTTSGSELSAPDDFARTEAGLQVMTNGLRGDGVDDLNASFTTYEQGTRLLRAATPVTPGAHTLYLSLFDQGDAAYDSAVFLAGLEAVNAPAAACTSGLAPVPSGPSL